MRKMQRELEKRLKTYRKILKNDPVLSELSEEMFFKENREDARAVVSLFVTAPVLCRFIQWVLQEAWKAGKKRLYFLARDGYSMYQAARILCEKNNIPVECRYLYCSRYALRSAEYMLLEEESLFYICLGGIDITFEKVMLRAGLNREEAELIGRLLGYSGRLGQRMSYAQVKALVPELSSCKVFMELMRSHSAEKYPEVCGYLRQEGLLEDIPYAVVDSGWTGSIQKSLQRLLGSMGCRKGLEGYYFGLYEYPKQADSRAYHTYYFEPSTGLRRKVYFSNSLFECICSSPEGMAKGYVKQGEVYAPVFEQKENPNREKIEKSIHYLQEYASGFAECAAFTDGANLPQGSMQDRNAEGILPGTAQVQKFIRTAAKLLKQFMGHPSMEEAKEYGSYVFCDDVIGERLQTVAAPLAAEDLKDNRLMRRARNLLLKKGKPVRESAWIEGSTVLAGRSREVWHCALYKYALYIKKRGRDWFGREREAETVLFCNKGAYRKRD